MKGLWHPVIAAVVTGGLVGLSLSVAAVPLLIAVTLMIAGTLLFTLSHHALWALTLLLFAALPLAYLPVPATLLTASPPALILVVLSLRVLVEGTGPVRWIVAPVVLLILSFAGWLALTVVASPYRSVGVGWLVSYACLAVLPALLARRDPRIRHVLRRTWIGLGAVLGAYALLETFLFEANPLLDSVYSAGADPLVQEWSVYRATTTLGHPVSNGSFFAVAVPLALGTALYRYSVVAAVAALLAAGGVVASGSRSAFAAAVVGAAIVLTVPSSTPVKRDWPIAGGKAVAALAMSLALVLGSTYLGARDASGEGGASATFRVTQIPIAWQSVAESPVLGTGPGAASLSQESLLARIGGAGAFESYWLELAVGAGIPGLLLGAAVLVAAVSAALRSGAPDIAGAVIAWTVSVTFVNALEGGRPEHLVHGLVLAMAFAGSGSLRSRSKISQAAGRRPTRARRRRRHPPPQRGATEDLAGRPHKRSGVA